MHQAVSGRKSARSAVDSVPMNRLAIVLLAFFPIVVATAQAEEPSFKGRTLSQLTSDLESDNSRERLRGAFGLGKLGELAAPATMTLCPLLDDSNEDVRACAANALGLIGPKAKGAIPSLVAALRPCLKPPMNEDYEDLYRYAAKSLGKIGPSSESALPLLFDIVNAGDKNDDLWLISISSSGAFVGIGDPALDFLMTKLKETSEVSHFNVVSILADFGERAREALPILKADLKSEDSAVRQTAAFYIGDIGGIAVIPILISAVEDEDPDVYRAAASSLSELGVPAINALVKLLDGERAVTGAYSLGWVGSSTSRVRADDDEVEEFLAKLQELCLRAVLPLIKLLESDKPARLDAAQALGMIGKSAAEWVASEAEIAAEDRVSLTKSRDRITDGLLTALNTEDPDLFETAALALASIGSTAVVRLESLASDEGPTGAVARKALALIHAQQEDE